MSQPYKNAANSYSTYSHFSDESDSRYVITTQLSTLISIIKEIPELARTRKYEIMARQIQLGLMILMRQRKWVNVNTSKFEPEVAKSIDRLQDMYGDIYVRLANLASNPNPEKECEYFVTRLQGVYDAWSQKSAIIAASATPSAENSSTNLQA